MIYRIRVWESSSGEQRSVGEMVSEIADNGRTRSAFRYDGDYCAGNGAFALDPVSLPLKAESFSTDQPGVFGVFEDSLPDDWGRRLLVRRHRIARHDQNLPNLLLALANSGLGALAFSDQNKPAPPPFDTSILRLSELVAAAEKFERGEVRDSELSLLLCAGSSPGGARPKVVVFDEEAAAHYLAKLPSIKDQVDVVRIEAATMDLAERAGLVVPPTRLVQCAGKAVLLVRRFDVLPTGRRHMISFQTLLKAEGYYQLRYQDLLAVLRKYSHDPLEDSMRLYRQMVFNAVIGNTDDHLKNFWMIHDHRQGWRLSPAFDLVPDVGQRGEHVLFFDGGAYYPGRKALQLLGRRWGVQNADTIVDQVFDACSHWKELFSENDVTESDIARFSEIDSHLQ